MKQWIIDRYNSGQDKFIVEDNSSGSDIKEYNNYIRLYEHDNYYNNISLPLMTLHEFLFNPKWGFAKAFWGECTKWIEVMDGDAYDYLSKEEADEINDSDHDWHEAREENGWRLNLQQMVISEDPLKYLKQFKEK